MIEGVESRRGGMRFIEGGKRGAELLEIDGRLGGITFIEDGERGEELLGIERRRGGMRLTEGGERGEEVDETERRRVTFLEVDVGLGEAGDLGPPDRDFCRPGW